MSKWIRFHFQSSTGKTEAYLIVTKSQPETIIGEIKWYGPWRQYSFFPRPNTVFEKTCLTDITTFIKDLMEARKTTIPTP